MILADCATIADFEIAFKAICNQYTIGIVARLRFFNEMKNAFSMRCPVNRIAAVANAAVAVLVIFKLPIFFTAKRT